VVVVGATRAKRRRREKRKKKEREIAVFIYGFYFFSSFLCPLEHPELFLFSELFLFLLLLLLVQHKGIIESWHFWKFGQRDR